MSISAQAIAGIKTTRRYRTQAELIRHGQITVGVIRPMGCVAIANDAHQSLAMLVRRKGESLPQLLERLDASVGKALHEEIYTDEINNPSAT